MVNKGTVSEILLYTSLIQFCHISYPHETYMTAVIRDLMFYWLARANNNESRNNREGIASKDYANITLNPIINILLIPERRYRYIPVLTPTTHLFFQNPLKLLTLYSFKVLNLIPWSVEIFSVKFEQVVASRTRRL